MRKWWRQKPTRGHIATAILRLAANLQPKHQLHCGLHKIFFFPKLQRLKLERVLSLLVARTNRNTTHGWYCFDNVRSAFCKHYFARAHEIQNNCRLNSQKIIIFIPPVIELTHRTTSNRIWILSTSFLHLDRSLHLQSTRLQPYAARIKCGNTYLS